MANPIAVGPAFEVPKYTISFRPDNSLQFDPPQGSKELAIALSIQFPLQITLEEKLREATLLFLRNQHQVCLRTSTQQKTTIVSPVQSLVEPKGPEETRRIHSENAKEVVAQTKQSDPIDQARSSSSELSHQATTQVRAQPKRSHGKALPFAESSSTTAEYTWNSHTGDRIKKRTRRTFEAAESVQVHRNRGQICENHRAKKTKCDPAKCPGNKLFNQASVPVAGPPESCEPCNDMYQSYSSSQASDISSSDCPTEITASGCFEGCIIAANHSHTFDIEPAESEMSFRMAPPKDIDQIPASLHDPNFEAMVFRQELNAFQHYFREGDNETNFVSSSNVIPDESGLYYAMLALQKRRKRKKLLSSSGKDNDDGDDPGNGGGGGGMNGRGGNDGRDGNGSGASGSSSGSDNNESSGNPFMGWDGGYGWAFSMSKLAILAFLTWLSRTRSSLAQLISWVTATLFSPVLAPADTKNSDTPASGGNCIENEYQPSDSQNGGECIVYTLPTESSSHEKESVTSGTPFPDNIAVPIHPIGKVLEHLIDDFLPFHPRIMETTSNTTSLVFLSRSASSTPYGKNSSLATHGISVLRNRRKALQMRSSLGRTLVQSMVY